LSIPSQTRGSQILLSNVQFELDSKDDDDDFTVFLGARANAFPRVSAIDRKVVPAVTNKEGFQPCQPNLLN